jgi:uncharacterized Tic20 family protein
MATEPGDEAGSVDPATGGTGVDYDVSDEEKTWGVLTHVSGLSGLVVPFGNVIGPLVVWLLKKDESRFVDENGKQALDFQITWTVLIFVSLLTVVLGIGLLLVPVLGLAWLILVVIATVRANEREVYDYPLTIDFV